MTTRERLISAIKKQAAETGKSPATVCRTLIKKNNIYLYERLERGTTTVQQFEKLQKAMWGKVK